MHTISDYCERERLAVPFHGAPREFKLSLAAKEGPSRPEEDWDS